MLFIITGEYNNILLLNIKFRDRVSVQVVYITVVIRTTRVRSIIISSLFRVRVFKLIVI